MPGVKELLAEHAAPPPAKRTRFELYKMVDPDYYGFRDDEDGVLEPLEKAAEAAVLKQTVAVWKKADDENKKELALLIAGGMMDAPDDAVRATAPVIQCGTRVLVPLLDSLMFGRVLK